MHLSLLGKKNAKVHAHELFTNFSLLDALNQKINLSEQKGVSLAEPYSMRTPTRAPSV